MSTPWLVRHAVYPLHERLMRRPTMSYVDSLNRTQWMSRGEIEQLQEDKLTSLLRIALLHSPWHAERIRAAGLNVDSPHWHVVLDDLRRLPTMDKADARVNVDRIRWRGVPGGAFKYNTGGSSGQPLIFYFGRQRQASDAAGRIRARRWWGVDLGEREVYLWGAPAELDKTDRKKTIRDGLLNQLVLNAFEMSAANMDRYLSAIEAYRPRSVYGYASSIALLAGRAKTVRKRLRLPGLRVVCTTGEPLYPQQRALIEEVFGAPVANEFGSRDIGFTAHESPQGQMLLMSESIVLEVLDRDGEPCAVGELGEAVMTGLCSDAQPFIRYRTGDMVRASSESCRHGRGLHVLGEVVGRSTDFVVRSDGTVMHALAVIYVLRAVDGVAEFKVIQHTVRDIEVLVVATAGWTDVAERKIEQGLAARLGSEARIRVRRVDAIAAESSGKYRYVVSHVPLDAVVDPEFAATVTP